MRYYMGVDWGDRNHAVWVSDDRGAKVAARTVPQTVEGLQGWGQWLQAQRAAGHELGAAIEKPDGRLIDFLLDQGVVVYPLNPKAVDRARDRFRMSQAKSDAFDARVLAEFLRTDHAHLQPLQPSSEAAQELKLLTRDYQRMVRQQTRLLNQLTATLKEYYPRALELWEDLATPAAQRFLTRYPTPTELAKGSRRQWDRFARDQHLTATRAQELWAVLQAPQLPVPAHVGRAKSRLMHAVLTQLPAVSQAVRAYRSTIEDFFAALPGADWARSLPCSGSGILVPALYAELGDAPARWQSFRHLQAQAGTVPVTVSSGKSQQVRFRLACQSPLRYAITWLAFGSLRQSVWARAYYRQQRARGHSHHRALRALGAKWLKIIFVMGKQRQPYDEARHLASLARQHCLQVI